MCLSIVVCSLVLAQAPESSAPPWLGWSAAQAESVGMSTYRAGRIGSRATMRLLKTERAINYKMTATWMTPEVIHAAARMLQLRERLTDMQVRGAASEAENAGDTVIMIEIDPNEGSGVIPLDWDAFLQPKGRSDRVVRGVKSQKLRDVRVLAGIRRRNYDYDRFWVVFPLTTADGQPVFEEADAEAELTVRIYDREERISWPIPASIRARTSAAVARTNRSTP